MKQYFLELCNNMGLTPKKSFPWNPQANSIPEYIYQVLEDVIRVFDLANTLIDPDEENPFNKYLSSVFYAIRSLYHQTHGHSPSQLVFGRECLLTAKLKLIGTKLDKGNKLKLKRTKKEKMLVVSIILIRRVICL